jgi:hypothetical protein
MEPLGTDYILYGVGYSATGEPFSHYDPATGQNIPLGATEEFLMEEVQRALDSVTESAASVASFESELRKARKLPRKQRALLSQQVAQARKLLASRKKRSSSLTAFYADPERRQRVLTEYRSLSELARNYDSDAYDLNDPEDRRRFKTRLLGFIRPQARDLLLQVAHNYKERFERPLPISSLVRPVQYQRELARTNANATRGPTPPHSTGLAFDLYYKYMSATEQEFLMSEIASLKDEGRVEAIREARDNIHVYVFGNGQRPDERQVDRLIASTKPAGKKPRAGRRR